jgi:WD40 repeat protein
VWLTRLASQRCQPSPDGSFVASLTFQSPTAAIVTIRTTESLQTHSVIQITQQSTNPVSGLAWSPTSSRVLIYTSDQIRVYNVEDASLHSVVRNPGAGANKPTHVQFGATDDEVIALSAFGLKISIFNVTTSKAVEIANPKFYHAASAYRGFCFGPSAHIAILTRSSGRDMLSIHQPRTREVVRSWFPEALDAAGLVWTPDGQWLLTWESPAHGHRLLVYTPDGQLVRTLDSSRLSLAADASLYPGLRNCQVSDNGSRCALGDYSRAVTVLDTQTWRVELRLVHPLNVTPHDTLQVR